MGTPLAVASTLSSRTLDLCSAPFTEAVVAVTNAKFPRATVEVLGDGGMLKLYGASKTDPTTFGALDIYLQTGSKPKPASPVNVTGAVPGAARFEEPVVAEPYEEVLAELEAIIGQPELKRQVTAIVTQVQINRKREVQGLKASRTANHMVFVGPPGTGKTTVARIVARLFHALGLLEGVEVHEVSRPDLISQNIGGTEEKTAKAIDNAMGGVLFIDEAYSLASGGANDFGAQAIDVLLKEVEDRRDQFVCILAGYTDRMKEFMSSNPGLRSRFPRTIDFTPYSADELVEIARSMATGMDNRLSDDAADALRQRLTDEEHRGGFARDEWGNARSVRNIVEAAVTHRDLRIGLSGAHDLDSLVDLTPADMSEACDDLRIGRAEGIVESIDDVLAELDAQVGQPQLKQQIRAILAQARVQQAKQAQGLSSAGSAIEHLLFVGPPGTGKTTIARLVARLYRALGLLSSDALVEVDRQKLVAGYVGQTAIQTSKKIDEAMGGVLFIDEAYALAKGGANDFGAEAIDTLLPRLENDRGKFLAIAAGYPDQMQQFLNANPGMRSRFTTRIEFLSYSVDELVKIAAGMATSAGEHLTEGASELLRQRLAAVERSGGFMAKDWGNARAARNVVDRAAQMRDLRVSDGDLSADPDLLVTITEADVAMACDREGLAADAAVESADDVLAELDAQVGQPQLKQQIRALLAQAKLAVQRREAGLSANSIPIEHLLFVGPPGTGKTTIARLVARLYRALGLLSSDALVEVDRQKLVAGYVGQTAIQTSKKIDEAMGGVLFIDEAYALAKGGANDFGAEAIDTLLPRLENDRGKFLAIAAGYPDQMQQFLNANPGMRSRFTTRIEFLSYSVDELVKIAAGMADRAGQLLDEEALGALRDRLSAAERSGLFGTKDWGNARQARIIVEDAMKRRDLRLDETGYAAADEMITLTAADFNAACVGLNIGQG
ncbi:MAG: AAA family ATPase [Microbacteriaceae bacterium]